MNATPTRAAWLFVAACGIAGAAAVRAQEADPATQAQAAASAWLAVVDAGDYARSWDDAAFYFQRSLDKPGWLQAVGPVRARVGALQSRRLRSVVVTHSLPGAPDGAYVVIRYDSVFDALPAAVETVTPMKEKDGSWKVSGYFIR